MFVAGLVFTFFGSVYKEQVSLHILLWRIVISIFYHFCLISHSLLGLKIEITSNMSKEIAWNDSNLWKNISNLWKHIFNNYRSFLCPFPEAEKAKYGFVVPSFVMNIKGKFLLVGHRNGLLH